MKTDFSFETRMRAGFAALILVFIFAPLLLRSVSAPYWFYDNFFNTLKISENFREKGFPTFDGITPTNDFSLLWILMISGLSAVVSSKTTAFFILVRLVSGVALGCSLWLFNRLIDALEFKPEKETRFLAFSFLAALFLYAALTGSDVALAVPCVFVAALSLLNALKHPSVKSGIVCGLAVSLCAFARFDSAAFFLTALLVFYFQFNRKDPISSKQSLILLSGIVIGLIPLMFYADMLQTKFGSPVPAELLSWKMVQGSSVWRILVFVFYEPFRYILRMPDALALMTFPVLLLLFVAYASFPWQEQKQTPKDTVFYSLIWYPIVYLTVLAAATFIILPDYAFYPFAVGAPLALMFVTNNIDKKVNEKEKKQARTVWLTLGFLLMTIAFFSAIKPRSAYLPYVIRTISEFTDRNPGRYAMGYGAGFSSFMTGKDFVRLDGSAEDITFLDMLSKQDSLDKVFQNYKVDYYIAVNIQKGENCYSAREPVQNRFGGTNKGMSDWLCAEPVFEKLATPKRKISVFKINNAGKAETP